MATSASGITLPVFQVLSAVTASVTTGGATVAIDCAGWQNLMVQLSITSGTGVSGSASVFRVWLQGQLPNTSVWSDLVIPYACKSLGVLATPSVVTTMVSTVTNPLMLASEVTLVSSTAISYFTKLNCPPPYVRVVWQFTPVSGAPSVDIKVDSFLSQGIEV
jgi:hypothetical protein